ncbi:SPO22-domain-containing protein [Zopfia rhizophila CBS 207.26]|uniref:Protein ZIP4 homolog n=1 Tax=Zopfia rhizophila CBS 207.26 TaxID=1314779 RepID=A0A6A6EFH9_9PEZI|nr:SPO22-domain-containing protein [Zopfia rhizophila CBS 207.26]
MAPAHSSAKTEREKKLKSLLSFASDLTKRLTASPHDITLIEDLQTHIRNLPFPFSPTVAAKQDELDRTGTELWNLSTRLRREYSQPNGRSRDDVARKKRALCLLRVLAFLLLDTAGGQATKGREVKNCIRLMKVALKAARVCLDDKQLDSATKVLERAADYQDILGNAKDGDRNGEANVSEGLRIEYFAVRTALAWRQDRMDTAEHMFSKSKQLNCEPQPSTAENMVDLLYEMGKDLLGKRNYELAVRWLERAHDVLGEQGLENLSPDAGELRLSIMQSLVQAYMKLKSTEAQRRAWDLVNLLDTDYGEKMVVQLLKLELLSESDTIDSSRYYTVLLRLIRSVVLTDTNFRTIIHYIHKIKDHSNVTARRSLDDLIELRLLSDQNQDWIEKAVITRIWVGTTGSSSEQSNEPLQELFENISRKTKHPLSAPATHAAQTLLWKRVEATYSQEQYAVAESWCLLSLHPLFEKAGELNKAKIARKVILCALARQDYAAAREVFLKMSDTGRDEPISRYLMYKVALNSGDSELAVQCLDLVCRQSSKDATLLYACVLEAQNSGNKRQAIVALEKVLDKYEYSAPAGIHLPALLRCTARLLVSELIKDGNLNQDVLEEICKVFESGASQAKASRRRPSTPAQQLFTSSEFEWFSKNAYNLSLKYCAEMHPASLARILDACIQLITLLKEQDQPEATNDLPLRLMFCNFLAACAYTTLARAEDNIQDCLQCYLAVRRHSQDFRRTAAEQLQAEKLEDSAVIDVISKHFQVVKLELEAALKLEDWASLEALFEECWKYKNPNHYETLADLILIIHSCIVKADLDGKYQTKVFTVLQKIINLTWCQSNNDIVKLSRWIRCLFQLALTFDESISLKCLDQAKDIASVRKGVSTSPLPLPAEPFPLNSPPPSSSPMKANADVCAKGEKHYPSIELEWLATTAFNHAVDYYVANDDERCRLWAEKALALAQVAEDGGELRGLLMGKYSGLVWKE